MSLVSVTDLEPHRRVLWAVAYRMTGVAADADDVVQETFARAIAKPPKRDRPLRPWLITVAMNVARDALRRRRRTEYVGPWLPSPVDDAQLDVQVRVPDDAPDARYSMKESATFAFLVAVEALTPQRRAVLILRDVFDYSTEETATALGMSPDAVKQSLLRARRALASYDAVREPALDERRERDRVALTKFFVALASGNAKAVEDLLADDVEAHSDGGGEFTAARVVMRGPEKVATVFTNLARLGASSTVGMELRDMNGTTVAVLRFDTGAHHGHDAHNGHHGRAHLAPTTVWHIETNPGGEIVRIYSVLAPRKLTALA